MRRFVVHLVTEIDFVDGDEASDEAVRNGCGANVLRSSQAGTGTLRWITQREPHSKFWEPCCPWCPVYRV
jgi:hypothetical protein